MYYAHFGLTEPPFRITPNTEVFFAGGNRGAILDALIYAISQGEGIVKVTGEVGTGKTMLCSMLQSRLPQHVETVYLAHPSVSPEEILHAIAFELQLNVPREAGRIEVMQALYAHLVERHAQGKQVVIFIEESQNMPIATLEEVRLLSNLETGKYKLLQIVLFGQPELDENLRQPHIRQLRERITHSFVLPPLKPPEIGEYLMFRLRASGYRGPDLFNSAVIKRIARASAGLTRRINLIADKALLAAFSENTHTVQRKHVAAAVRDSEFARDWTARAMPKSRWWVAGAVGLAGIAISGYAVLRYFDRPAATSDKPSAAQSGPRLAVAPAVVASAPGLDSAPIETPTSSSAIQGVASGSARLPQQAEAMDQSAGSAVNTGGAVALAQQRRVEPVPGQPPRAPEQQTKTSAIQGDVLEARIVATREWLREEDAQTHSIQLLGSDNRQQLKDHLNSISKSIEITHVFVYRTVAKQKPFLTVLYGSFPNRDAAQDALERLPPPLRAFKPYLRTVQGIREEMSRNNTL
jgi:MSHA biogenesis protein MshM